MIKKIKTAFPHVEIGYSDHTASSICCYMAVHFGARIIEKHFTDDKNYSSFRDHQLSADYDEFRQMVDGIRDIETMIANKEEISKGEVNNIIPFRRSMAAKTDLNVGDKLTAENTTFLRPATGIPVIDYYHFLGKRVVKSLKAGEILHRRFLKS